MQGRPQNPLAAVLAGCARESSCIAIHFSFICCRWFWDKLLCSITSGCSTTIMRTGDRTFELKEWSTCQLPLKQSFCVVDLQVQCFSSSFANIFWFNLLLF